MEKTSIEAIAKKYDLAVDFVKSLHDKIIDKENFARAVKMFNDGLLPYDMATGNEPINVAEYRSKVARNMWNRRKLQAEQFKATMEHQKESLNIIQNVAVSHSGTSKIKPFWMLFSSRMVNWSPLVITSQHKAEFMRQTMK